MSGKVSPIFQLFSKQFDVAKQCFFSLSKVFRGKKAIELEQRLIFLEIYIDLISRIHFDEKKLKFELFSPFKGIYKNLKKVKHLNLVIQQLELAQESHQVNYNTYEKHLYLEKKKIYAEGFDLIVSSPLKIWDKL